MSTLPSSEIYHKSNELYGIYFAKQAIVRQDRCFLVEGYTDVISMHQSGIENVVASSGTALTPGQIRLIHRFTNNITVLYDGDVAGIKASIRGIDMLLEEGMNIKVCLLPDGDDPGLLSPANIIRKNSRHSSVSTRKIFIRFKTDLLMEDAGRDPIKTRGTDFEYRTKHFRHTGSHYTGCLHQRMQPTSAHRRKTAGSGSRQIKRGAG